MWGEWFYILIGVLQAARTERLEEEYGLSVIPVSAEAAAKRITMDIYGVFLNNTA